MKLNRIITLPILAIALTSCGSGPSKVTGVSHTFYIVNEENKTVLEPKDYIKEKDKIGYPLYQVRNYTTYVIQIKPSFRGSKLPRFSGDLATFSESEYWKIEFDEEASKDNNPFYNITVSYPTDAAIDDTKLEFSAAGFINHIYISFTPYEWVA